MTHPAVSILPVQLSDAERAGLVESFGSEEAALDAARVLVKGRTGAPPLAVIPAPANAAPAAPAASASAEPDYRKQSPNMPPGFRPSILPAAEEEPYKITTPISVIERLCREWISKPNSVNPAGIEAAVRAGDEQKLFELVIAGGRCNVADAIASVTDLMQQRARALRRNPKAFDAPTAAASPAAVVQHPRVVEAHAGITSVETALAAATAKADALEHEAVHAKYLSLVHPGDVKAAGRAVRLRATADAARREVTDTQAALRLARDNAATVAANIETETRTASLAVAVAAADAFEHASVAEDTALAALAEAVAIKRAAAVKLNGCRSVVPNLPTYARLLARERVQGAVAHAGDHLREYLELPRVEPSQRKPFRRKRKSAGGIRA